MLHTMYHVNHGENVHLKKVCEVKVVFKPKILKFIIMNKFFNFSLAQFCEF
jgi:hypothetical protein